MVDGFDVCTFTLLTAIFFLLFLNLCVWGTTIPGPPIFLFNACDNEQSKYHWKL
jgi:hypothetical protein